jgi:sigma54-dependent transcription regulator
MSLTHKIFHRESCDRRVAGGLVITLLVIGLRSLAASGVFRSAGFALQLPRRQLPGLIQRRKPIEPSSHHRLSPREP